MNFERGQSQEQYANPEAEQSPEQIMDNYARQRGELFQNVMVSYGSGDREPLVDPKLMEKIKVNAPFFIGEFFTARNLIRGSEGGQPLSTREKVFYGIALSTSAISAGLLLSGEYKAGLSLAGISEGVQHADNILTVMKLAAAKIAEKNPNFSHIIESVADWARQRPEALPAVQTMLERFDGND